MVLLVLWLMLEKTRIGLIVRAGARDPTIMQVLGVDIGRVWLAIFGLGVGLAALGGVLAGAHAQRQSGDGLAGAAPKPSS